MNKQQKKTTCEQFQMFTRKGEPAEGDAGRTGRTNETGVVLSSQSGQEGQLIETAVVREYARWCGRTAVRAAFYPIRNNVNTDIKLR
jgi:hypothetical protein